MAEDKEGKTEPATARRRQEAADAGNFPRSTDLTSAVLLLAGLLVVQIMGKTMVAQLADVLRALLGNNFAGPPADALNEAMRTAGPAVVRIMGPILLTMFVVSVAVNVMQVGFRLTGKPLQPNLSRLNPAAGLSRLFTGQNWFQLAMNLVKLTAVAAVAVVRIRQQFAEVMTLPGMDFPQNMIVGVGLVFDLALRIAVTLLILAVLDWIYRKWKYERDLRMTKQEVKDEAKSMEGDQEIKSRRRSLARKMILQRIHQDVPRADVVVTNPTHLAIALKYDPEKMNAPRVVAKGADYLALRIRQVALANGVPLVERKTLAQALYKSVEVGQEVPPEFYQAIAEILAYVFELSGKSKAVRRAG